MIQILPQEPGLAELLGTGLRTGIATGAQFGLQSLLKKHLSDKNMQPLDVTELDRYLKGLNINVDALSSKDKVSLLNKANYLIPKFGRNFSLSDIATNLDKYLGTESDTIGEILQDLEETVTEKPKEKIPGKVEKGPALIDLILGKRKPVGLEEVIAKKPSEIVGLPARGWLDFIAESLGKKPLAMGLKPEKGKITVEKSPIEEWREKVKEGLSEKAKESIIKGEVGTMLLTDIIGGLLKQAPKEGLKLAEDIIKAKNYPKETLRTVEDLTKEYKPKIEVPKGISQAELEEMSKIRKEKAEELAKRPLEEYAKPKKEYESPAQKAEKLKASKELIRVDNELKTMEENINKIEKALTTTKSKKNIDLLNKAKRNFEENIKNLKEERKIQEYISKKGREPFSYEKTLEEANKHNKQIKYAYDHPESLESQEIIKQFNRDQKYIEEALDILKKRKETPIAPYEDFYQKKLQTYNDSYKKMILELDKQINETSGKIKKNLEGLRDKFKANLNINESKLIKHRDKLKTLKDIQQSNAFLKHELATLRNDIPIFEKDLIKYKNILTPQEELTTEIFRKKIKELKKAPIESEKYWENFSKTTKIPQDEIKKAQKTAKNFTTEITSAINKAETQKSLDNYLNSIKDKLVKEMMFYKTKTLPKLKKSLLGAIVFEVLQRQIEKSLGIKLPFSFLAYLTPGTRSIRFGATLFANAFRQIEKLAILPKYYERKWEKTTSYNEKVKLIEEMKKSKLSNKQIKEIIK